MRSAGQFVQQYFLRYSRSRACLHPSKQNFDVRPWAELQNVVDLPPNLKFMVSPLLILTQYKITEKQLDGVFCITHKHAVAN